MPLSLNVGASKSSVAHSFLSFIDLIQSHGSDIILYAHGSQSYDNGMNLFSKLQAHLSNSLLDDSFGKAKSNMYKLLPVHTYTVRNKPVPPTVVPLSISDNPCPKCSDFDAALASTFTLASGPSAALLENPSRMMVSHLRPNPQHPCRGAQWHSYPHRPHTQLSGSTPFFPENFPRPGHKCQRPLSPAAFD